MVIKYLELNSCKIHKIPVLLAAAAVSTMEAKVLILWCCAAFLDLSLSHDSLHACNDSKQPTDYTFIYASTVSLLTVCAWESTSEFSVKVKNYVAVQRLMRWEVYFPSLILYPRVNFSFSCQKVDEHRCIFWSCKTISCLMTHPALKGGLNLMCHSHRWRSVQLTYCSVDACDDVSLSGCTSWWEAEDFAASAWTHWITISISVGTREMTGSDTTRDTKVIHSAQHRIFKVRVHVKEAARRLQTIRGFLTSSFHRLSNVSSSDLRFISRCRFALNCTLKRQKKRKRSKKKGANKNSL